ncbi:Mariner Mos1 transposase [Eumeta japonica]|uniref:Mariner Mos1 transposase n=1 Tax=Eumeta variegata TaxID=151549 RepID=A0A4C1YJD1_EUMVA|nr:Mariner Mos1 transposase [Eumeta japonica]
MASNEVNCFICCNILQESEVIEVKEKELETFRQSSIKRKDNKYKLLVGLKSIVVHDACRKRYNNEKLIAAAHCVGATRPNSTATKGEASRGKGGRSISAIAPARGRRRLRIIRKWPQSIVTLTRPTYRPLCPTRIFAITRSDQLAAQRPRGFDGEQILQDECAPSAQWAGGVIVRRSPTARALDVRARPQTRFKALTMAWIGVFEEIRNNNRQHKIIFLHDDPSFHTSAETTRFLEGQKIELTARPLYSPDLAPNDFCLFPSVKNKLRDQRFSSREEAVDAFKTYVLEISQSEWKKCIKVWCIQKCINHHAALVEGESTNLFLTQITYSVPCKARLIEPSAANVAMVIIVTDTRFGSSQFRGLLLQVPQSKVRKDCAKFLAEVQQRHVWLVIHVLLSSPLCRMLR